jgi:hypothetical protein
MSTPAGHNALGIGAAAYGDALEGEALVVPR